MTAAPPRPRSVTLHTPWLLILIGVPLMGVFAFGLIWAVVDAVAHGDADRPFHSSGIAGFGVVIGWTIAAVILIPCAFAVVALPMLRVRFADDRIRMRKLVRYRTIRLTDLSSVIVTNPAAWRVNGPRSSVAPCLELRGRTPGGKKAYIGINSKMLDWTPGLLWLEPWLRRHPDRTDANTLRLLDELHAPPVPADATPAVRADAGHAIDAMDLVAQLQREERASDAARTQAGR